MNDLNGISFKTSANSPFSRPPRLRIANGDGFGVPSEVWKMSKARRASGALSEIDLSRIEGAIREIILVIGGTPDREGLRETAQQVAKAYQVAFAGVCRDAGLHLSRISEQNSQRLVIVGGIDFASICERDLLPFMGRVHVAYLPSGGRVVGVSEFADTVDALARRPQVQQRLTEQVADAVHSHLLPLGTCVWIDAEHLSMKPRDADKLPTLMSTLAFRGIYRADHAARAEVLSLIKRGC